GRVVANGGKGAGGGPFGGGGGGGRIAMEGKNRFSGVVEAAGAKAVGIGAPGQHGSIHIANNDICDSGSLAESDTCEVSSSVLIGGNAAIEGAGNLTIAATGALRVVTPLNPLKINI